MGGGGDAQRRWGWRTGESDRGPSDQKYNLRRRPRLEPSGEKALKRRTTSYERIHELADWKRIGLHKKYADATMSRPLTRGWLHIGVAAIATSIFASAAGRSALAPAPVRLFWLVTFVLPYWASTALHFIPWKRRTAHDIALVFDFIGISLGFSGQTAAWAGSEWWDPTRDASPVAWAARVNAVATAVLVLILFVGVLNRKREPVMLYMRNVRFTIMGVNMLLLGFVETARIADRRLNLAVQLLGKAFVPGYFVKCVAVDASSRGPLPLWPGVWSAHENWHCVVFLLHVMQLYALTTHHGTWPL